MIDVLDTLAPDLHSVRWGEQVHGCKVQSLASQPGWKFAMVGCIGRCDALITADSGLGLVVWTADCVPVLISGGPVVAAVHSGWRGAAEDVTGAVVRRFGSEYGVRPEQLRAALGPAISGHCYPVGAEVVDALRRHAVDESRWLNGHHVDLRAFLEARLESCGVVPTAITTFERCTASSPDLASHRRDGDAAGRQWSLIYRPAAC